VYIKRSTKTFIILGFYIDDHIFILDDLQYLSKNSHLYLNIFP
jgi:hypothetical protein